MQRLDNIIVVKFQALFTPDSSYDSSNYLEFRLFPCQIIYVSKSICLYIYSFSHRRGRSNDVEGLFPVEAKLHIVSVSQLTSARAKERSSSTPSRILKKTIVQYGE